MGGTALGDGGKPDPVSVEGENPFSPDTGTGAGAVEGLGVPQAVTAGALFEALPCSMVLIDRDANILSMTRRGEQLLADNPLFVDLDGSRSLRLRDPYHQRRLTHAIGSVTFEGHGVPTIELTITDSVTSNAVALALAPVSDTVIVACMDECVRRPLPELPVLREAFGLTATEARIARHIGEGLRLSEIADRLEASVHTVRLHCKRVLHKAGAGRQADLVRIILDLGSPAARS